MLNDLLCYFRRLISVFTNRYFMVIIFCGEMMKRLIVALLFIPTITFGAVIASMPNQAGGKIVLTDEACVYRGKNYTSLFKAYFYTTSGITGDGCWAVEDGSDSVTVIWHDSGDTKRYPASNFDIRRK